MSCRLPLWLALLALTIAGSLAQDETTDPGTTLFSSSLGVDTTAKAAASTAAPSTAAQSPAASTPTSTAAPAPATTTLPDPNAHSLQWIVLHAENPSGLLNNGASCTDFAFAGVQCSLSFEYGIKTSPMDELIEQHTDTFPYGNSVDNTVIHKTSLSGDAFQGFELSGTLKGNGNDIAHFTFDIPSNQPKGILTITDSATGAAVKIAWKSGLKPPVTTVQPTTQESTPAETTGTGTTESAETAGTGTTPAITTQAPFYPKDCDDYTGDARTKGPKTIYIGGDPTRNITVYCEFGSSGALTTIQSRGEQTDNVVFSDEVADYKQSFGTAGKGNNFWFGLDNMHDITADGSYNLFVEVCCSTGSSQQQRYHDFTISDNATNYVLNATADTPGIGLDIKALGQLLGADIGAPFTTKNTIQAVGKINPEYCEILEAPQPGFAGVISVGSGGWWFGSCANNLNGRYLAVADLGDKCAWNIPNMNNSTGTGIALRTTTGIIDTTDQTYLDHVSYTRARMAIYKDPLQGISTDFCST